MDGTTGAAAGVDIGISEEEQETRLAAMVDHLQTRDAIRRYSWLSQRCFSDCVSTFYRKNLGKDEGTCVRACVRKYQLLTSASDARFRKLANPAAFDVEDD